MVVWRPSVARMVYLHTGTMGVHHACLLSFEARSCHSRGLDLAGKLIPVLRIPPVPAHQLAGARPILWRDPRRRVESEKGDRVIVGRARDPARLVAISIWCYDSPPQPAAGADARVATRRSRRPCPR